VRDVIKTYLETKRKSHVRYFETQTQRYKLAIETAHGGSYFITATQFCYFSTLHQLLTLLQMNQEDMADGAGGLM
jgi:hypothetical protein